MPGQAPWEQYAAGSGPWEKYGAAPPDAAYSEAAMAANPPVAPPVAGMGVLGRPAMPGVSSRYAGPQSVALPTGVRASREEMFTQPAQGVRELGQGNIKTGLSDVIEGGSKLAAPLGVLTAPFAPAATLGSIGAGTALSEGGELAGKLLNWSPESIRLASDLGGVAGSTLGAIATPSEISESIGRATRVQPTVDNSPTTGTLGRPKTVASLKPGVKALGSIFKVVGGPEVLNAVLPEHPEPTGPFRRLASGPMRPGGIPGRALPAGPPVPDVNVVPEPRAPQPGDRPGAMWTIPRTAVPGEAQRGSPGAGDVLRNIGKTVIYQPPGVGYGGPRESPLGQISSGSPQINFMRDNLGVNWAERNGVRVSIPRSVPEDQLQDYAAQKLDEQETMRDRIH